MTEPHEDQVPRLEKFRAAHPGIRVDAPAGTSGLWSAHRGGQVLVAEYDLGRLLDRLEALLGGAS